MRAFGYAIDKKVVVKAYVESMRGSHYFIENNVHMPIRRSKVTVFILFFLLAPKRCFLKAV